MSKLRVVVEEFTRRHGMDKLHPDEEGRFHIRVDEAPVRCFERFEQLHLVSPLGTPPEPGEARRTWVKHILNYALKRMKDSHNTPALEEDGGAILLTRCEIKNLSVHDFEARIEEHVNALERYQHLLTAADHLNPKPRFAQTILRP